MDLHVAKWGKSLALRLTAEYVRSLSIKDGDSVEASLTIDGGLTLRPARWNRQGFAASLARARKAMVEACSI